MRNGLYLLLPITGSESTCKEEGVYLTSLTTDYNSFLTGVFKTILHIYTHEDFNVYYDPSRLSALLNAAKQENEGQYTEAHKLLRLLAKKDFREYADIYKQTSPITVNGVHIAQGILRNCLKIIQ